MYDKVVDIARNLSSGITSSPNTSNIFLTLDVGKNGSNSVEWVLGLSKYNLKNKSSDVITSVKKIVPALYGQKWTFKEWEESNIKATTSWHILAAYFQTNTIMFPLVSNY